MTSKNLIMVLALLGLVSSVATAQDRLLDGTWIRMNVSGTGHQIGDKASSPPRTFATLCFMRLTYVQETPAFGQYHGRTVCKSDRPGNWYSYGDYGDIIFDLLPGGGVVANNYFETATVSNPRGQSLGCVGVHFLFPVIRHGILRNVTLSSGGYTIGGAFLGSFKMTGKSVPIEKVPADALAAIL